MYLEEKLHHEIFKEKGMHNLTKNKIIVSRIVLTILLVVSLFPIYYLFTTAIKARLLAFSMPPVWIFTPTMDNFNTVLSKASFMKSAFNSITVTLSSTLIALGVGSLAGYYLARSNLKKKNLIAGWILSTRMAPPIVVIIPFFLIINKLGLFDTRTALVILYTAFNLPLVVLISR
jgi:multiple sugar transport system permease protein